MKTADDTTPWHAALHRTATPTLWPNGLDPETLVAEHRQTVLHIAQVDTGVRMVAQISRLFYFGSRTAEINYEPVVSHTSGLRSTRTIWKRCRTCLQAKLLRAVSSSRNSPWAIP